MKVEICRNCQNVETEVPTANCGGALTIELCREIGLEHIRADPDNYSSHFLF